MLYPSDEDGDRCHGRPWLDEQYEYQIQTYGVNYAAMAEDPEELTTYVTSMLNAAFLELAEAQQETPWKPWATGDRGAAWAQNRDAFVGELVDTLFFVANALCAVGVTDEELARRYAAKMMVNVKRQETGYDYLGGKCAQCNRALDEPGATPVLVDGKPTFCDDGCRAEADRLNRETLRAIGFSDARIDAIGTANPNRVTVTYDRGDGQTSCFRCGYRWGPFELYAVGLDHRHYCSTEHAINETGGQLEPEDVDR